MLGRENEMLYKEQHFSLCYFLGSKMHAFVAAAKPNTRILQNLSTTVEPLYKHTIWNQKRVLM